MSCIGPKNITSHTYKSTNIELVSLQLMQIRNSKCLTEPHIPAHKAARPHQDRRSKHRLPV